MSQQGGSENRPNPLVQDSAHTVGLTGVTQQQTGNQNVGTLGHTGPTTTPGGIQIEYGPGWDIGQNFESEEELTDFINENYSTIFATLMYKKLERVALASGEIITNINWRQDPRRTTINTNRYMDMPILDFMRDYILAGDYQPLREMGISTEEIAKIEKIVKEMETQTEDSNNKNVNLKHDIVAGIKEALGIRDPTPMYKPSKETRDLNRLSSLNRIPPSKVWSKEELEYYNRKGKVTYRVKNVQGKRLPDVFNPLLPVLGYQTNSYHTSYSKPDFLVGREKEGLGEMTKHYNEKNKMPTSFLVN